MGGAVVQPLCHTEPDVSIKRGPTVVLLNIYDLGKAQGIQVLNTVLSALDTGAYHCGVEVHGREFSYEGGKNPGTGIFSCAPKFCNGHTFHQSILMGEIMLTADEVYNLVQLLEIHWPATGYHMLKRNCCHFCSHLCLCLGVGPVPAKIMSLARVVERVDAGRRHIGGDDGEAGRTLHGLLQVFVCGAGGRLLFPGAAKPQHRQTSWCPGVASKSALQFQNGE